MAADSVKAVEWYPVNLVRAIPGNAVSSDKPNNDSFALLVLNQPLQQLGVLRRLWKNSFTRVAADGGANRLYDAGGAKGDHSFDDLQVIIGDLDSLTDQTRAYFESGTAKTSVIHDPDQESTDFGKAVMHIRKQNPPPVDIVAVGGLGGRVDQGISQLHHLYIFQRGDAYDMGRLFLVSEESISFLLKAGKHRITVRDGSEEVFGKHVGILPIRERSVISTKGLEWDVQHWETEFGGRISTSNHVLPETEVVEVETTKDVILTIALKQLD